MPLGVFGMHSCSMTYCFSFFSVIATFNVASCIFVLKCFNWSYSLVPFPFLLDCYNGQYNQMKIMKRWIVTIKKSFANNMVILWSNFDIYHLLIAILILSDHDTVLFLFVTLTLNIFCTHLLELIKMTNTLGQMKKIAELRNHMHYIAIFHSGMMVHHYSVWYC